MEIIKTELKQLKASEGKVIVFKEKQYDENNKELPRDGAKVIYLAINSNENNYEEVDEKELEAYNKTLREEK